MFLRKTAKEKDQKTLAILKGLESILSDSQAELLINKLMATLPEQMNDFPFEYRDTLSDRLQNIKDDQVASFFQYPNSEFEKPKLMNRLIQAFTDDMSSEE